MVGAGGTGAGFISPDLASNGVQKSGYLVYIGAGGASPATGAVVCNGASPVNSGYAGWTDPATPGTSGTRYFGTNTTGTIWQATGTLSGIQAAEQNPAGGTPIQ